MYLSTIHIEDIKELLSFKPFFAAVCIVILCVFVVQAFLQDWDKVVAAAAGASLLALGYFTAKRATGSFIFLSYHF